MSPLNDLQFAALKIPRGKCISGDPLNIYGDLLYIKLASKDTADACTVIENIVPAGGGPPLHVHHREDETFFIIEGDYIFEIEGRRTSAHPGDFLRGPRNIPHTFQNVTAASGSMLLTVTPAGVEEFFRALAAIPGPPEPAKLLPVYQKYGIELLGPPLSAR